MKRKLEKVVVSPNKLDQDTSKTKKKKKKKNNEEEPIEIKEEYVIVDESGMLLDESAENAEDAYDSQGAGESSKKRKKKKKKKSAATDSDEIEFVETADELIAIEEVIIKEENPNGVIKDVWPKEKIIQLLNNISKTLPENDNLKYRSRLTKIDWNSISFEDYSAVECQAMWKCIQDKTRCFRILKEIVHDATEAIQQSSSLFYHGMVKDWHPEMPQKPLSSFMLFYMDTKDKIMQELPGINCPDLAKKVSGQWKALSQKKKDKYKNKAQMLRNEYEEKLSEFYVRHPEFVEEKKKKTKSNNDSLGFEKPKTAFQLYYHSLRDGGDHTDSKLIGLALLEKAKEDWKTMPQDSKVGWIEAAQKEEERYRERLKKYEQEHPGFEMPVVKPLLTKNDRNVLENMEGRPKKPPSNAYSLYSQNMLQSDKLKKLPSKERLTEISKLWKGLSDKEKQNYTVEVQKLQDTYKKQYDDFVASLPVEKRIQEEEKNRVKRKRGNDKKAVSEPEKPPINVVDYYKARNQNEWKKKSPKSNFDDMAKKKWRTLPKPMKSQYVDELKKLNDKYLDEYAKFLQQCPSNLVMQYLLKFTEHKRKIDEIENIKLNEGGDDED